MTDEEFNSLEFKAIKKAEDLSKFKGAVIEDLEPIWGIGMNGVCLYLRLKNHRLKVVTLEANEVDDDIHILISKERRKSP